MAIKHVSTYKARRRSFHKLVESMRLFYSCRILVNIDGTHRYDAAWLRANNVHEVGPRNRQLAEGRNILVRSSTAARVLVMDDDVVFTNRTRIERMILVAGERGAAVVSGCYQNDDCYSYRLIRGHDIVRMQRSSVYDADVGQNFLLIERRRLGDADVWWDNRTSMIEHEIFFFQLHDSSLKFAIASDVVATHNRVENPAHHSRSRRRWEAEVLPYMCINYPSVTMFALPYFTVDCHDERYAYHPDGTSVALSKDGHDTSTYMPMHKKHTDDSIVRMRDLQTYLMIAIPACYKDVAQRATLRRAWLRSDSKVSYAFFVGGTTTSARGDIVRLGGVSDSYDKLGIKVVRTFQWIDRHVSCTFVLKTDTDTYVNLDRVLSYLQRNPVDYGGYLAGHGFVIRENMTRSTPFIRQHPRYPDDFVKWAIPYALYDKKFFPPYAKGGGYVSRVLHHMASSINTVIDNLEDVTIGLWMHRHNVTLTPIPGFTEYDRASVRCPNNFKLAHRALLCRRPSLSLRHRIVRSERSFDVG